jgi:glutamine amidotransferase
MGWNQLHLKRVDILLEGIAQKSFVYFVHSYYVEPSDLSVACSVTEYGIPFVSSIWRDNIFACQFHPEKSQGKGLKLIENFLRLTY